MATKRVSHKDVVLDTTADQVRNDSTATDVFGRPFGGTPIEQDRTDDVREQPQEITPMKDELADACARRGVNFDPDNRKASALALLAQLGYPSTRKRSDDSSQTLGDMSEAYLVQRAISASENASSTRTDSRFATVVEPEQNDDGSYRYDSDGSVARARQDMLDANLTSNCTSDAERKAAIDQREHGLAWAKATAASSKAINANRGNHDSDAGVESATAKARREAHLALKTGAR